MSVASTFQPGTEGIFVGLDEKTYRAAPGVNVSALKGMRLSPKHYFHGLTEQSDSSKALVIGTIVHLATLQPELFAKSYVKRPERWKDWRTDASKAWRDEQIVPVITDAEELTIIGVRNAIHGHKRAWKIISSGDCEVACFRVHEATGLLMKGKADVLAMDDNGMMVLADVKTCGYGAASEDAFSGFMSEHNLHQQAAWYISLFGATDFIFIAAEKEPPYDVSLDHVHPDDLELGRRVNEAAIRRVAECQKQDRWPGYSDNIRTVRLRRWKQLADGQDLE